MENSILQWLQEQGVNSLDLLRLLFSLMLAILFLQSGIDKIINYKGEKSFYGSHFKDSILRGTEGLLMPMITAFELLSGLSSLLGIVFLLSNGDGSWGLAGALLSSLSIVQLFFGQRIAKDYGGAATLVPYFLLCTATVYLYTLT